MEYAPIYPPGVVDASTVNVQPIISEDTEIPEGYKRTKFEDTLEKKDLKPVTGQKAAKRFFCMKCMKQGVETGYTKRNDLNKHLEGCGSVKEKKYKCTYENCNHSYIRPDNLKQHIATVHTKQILYTCKKCNKGFTSSPEATAHRKICFPDKPDTGHVNEEAEDDDNKVGDNQEKDKDE